MTPKPSQRSKPTAVVRPRHTSDETLAAMHAMVEAAAKAGLVLQALLFVEHAGPRGEPSTYKPYSIPPGDSSVRGLAHNAYDLVEAEFAVRFAQPEDE